MEQNVARSWTCGEVLWCEVRFSLGFPQESFLDTLSYTYVKSLLSVLFSPLLFSFLVCPPLLSSPFYSLFSPPLLLPPLPFPSLLFLHSPLLHSGANTTTTTNTNTNLIRPLTPNLQPIKSLSALLPSHPLHPSTHQPLKKPQPYLHIPPKTKNIPQQQNLYLETFKSIHQPPTCSLSTSPRKV